jgi:hypothetical protein
MGHLEKCQINAPLYVFPQTKNNPLHFQNQRYIGIFMSQRERERERERERRRKKERESESKRERERHMPAYIGKSDKHAHMPPPPRTHTHTCAGDYISTVNCPAQNGKTREILKRAA